MKIKRWRLQLPSFITCKICKKRIDLDRMNEFLSEGELLLVLNYKAHIDCSIKYIYGITPIVEWYDVPPITKIEDDEK